VADLKAGDHHGTSWPRLAAVAFARRQIPQHIKGWPCRSPIPMLSVTAGTSSDRWRLRDRLCSRLNEEITLFQTYPRYSAHDFERRWQKRLSRPPRRTTDDSSSLHVDVTHRFPASNRYSWELRAVAGLPVEESLVQFASWEEASRAGNLALNQFLQTPLGSRFIKPAHA
jgi:hypothetical protein